MDLIDKVISKWNDCSEAYAQETENVTLQSAINLYNLVNTNKAKRIIDAGWGPGLSSQVLMTSLTKSGSTLYWVDIAEKMIDLLESKFNHDGWIAEGGLGESKNAEVLKCKNVTSYKRLETTSVRTMKNLESVENDLKVGSNGKKVFSMVADVEQLPFPDNSFDAYTANLVLQFTPNYLNALCESYRLLWEGGKASFSIWGREENCTFLTFLPDILEAHDIKIDPEFDIDFDLIDPDQIIDDAKDLGFKSAKKFHLPFYYSILSGEEMWEFLLNSSAKCQLTKLDGQTQAKVKEDVIKEFDQRYGNQTEDLICFEVTVILCTK